MSASTHLADAQLELQSADGPGPAAAVFAQVLAAEAWLVGKGIDPPFGLSAYVVARSEA